MLYHEHLNNINSCSFAHAHGLWQNMFGWRCSGGGAPDAAPDAGALSPV